VLADEAVQFLQFWMLQFLGRAHCPKP
jgi:hypothetical protein